MMMYVFDRMSTQQICCLYSLMRYKSFNQRDASCPKNSCNHARVSHVWRDVMGLTDDLMT